METSFATPRGNVTIRRANEEDLAAYRELRLEALRNHPEAFSTDYDSALARPMSFWTERLQSAGTETAIVDFIAVHDEQLIGMCAIVRRSQPKTRHAAEILGVYVRPEWRGAHIAEGLITACIDWARGHEVKVIYISAVTTNTSAIRCYAHCGFRVYGIEPQALFYDNVYYDEMMMTRTT